MNSMMYYVKITSALQDGRCAFDKTKVVSKVASFHKVKRLDEAALADAVASFGPVSVAIQATNKFQLYTLVE